MEKLGITEEDLASCTPVDVVEEMDEDENEAVDVQPITSDLTDEHADGQDGPTGTSIARDCEEEEERPEETAEPSDERVSGGDAEFIDQASDDEIQTETGVENGDPSHRDDDANDDDESPSEKEEVVEDDDLI